MKNIWFILLIVLLSLSAEKCKKEKGDQATDVKKMEKMYGEGLFRYWIHSREEDKDGIEVYRPNEYDFPPARGRDGFKINRDGSFFFIKPGPTDKPEITSKGNWYLDKQVLIVKYEGTAHEYSHAETKIEIVSFKNDVLTIKKF